MLEIGDKGITGSYFFMYTLVMVWVLVGYCFKCISKINLDQINCFEKKTKTFARVLLDNLFVSTTFVTWMSY